MCNLPHTLKLFESNKVCFFLHISNILGMCRGVGMWFHMSSYAEAYILYTKILYTFCIHQFWSMKSIHHKDVYNLYTEFMQNVDINNCLQNGSLILRYFDPFVVHFLVNHCKQLRLETCWLMMGGTYQSNGLLDYIFH